MCTMRHVLPSIQGSTLKAWIRVLSDAMRAYVQGACPSFSVRMHRSSMRKVPCSFLYGNCTGQHNLLFSAFQCTHTRCHVKGHSMAPCSLRDAQFKHGFVFSAMQCVRMHKVPLLPLTCTGMPAACHGAAASCHGAAASPSWGPGMRCSAGCRHAAHARRA